ncbi:MAG: DUF2201 family putative metallopeptidase, partial [Desulfurococcaceae archaeon]
MSEEEASRLIEEIAEILERVSRLDKKKVVEELIESISQRDPLIGALLRRTTIALAEVGELAGTDGIRIYLGVAFFALPREDQEFVLAHEAAHIALMHSTRYERVRHRCRLPGELCGELYDLLADAEANKYVCERFEPASIVPLTPRMLEEAFGTRLEGRGLEEAYEELAEKVTAVDLVADPDLENP